MIFSFYVTYYNTCIFKDLIKKLKRIKIVLSEITGVLETQF